MMNLAQLNSAINGQMVGADVMLDGITIDTRSDCTDQLFVALKGDNFDAHNFMQSAFEHGAKAALLDKNLVKDKKIPEFSHVLVDDTMQALGEMAAWWREQFAIPVVGITGSVGKTTVKEMVGSIFTEFFADLGSGVVTKGNLNNEIGVPLTIMRLRTNDLYAVIEMGMNHAGEIGRLTQIAKPTIALINNAAPAHLEGLGSVEQVALAKGEIFAGLDKTGTAIINADDVYAPLWKDLAKGHRIVTFGLDKSADIGADYQISATGMQLKINVDSDELLLKLPLLGKHNVSNVLAAVAIAHVANIPMRTIADGLAKYRPITGRLVSHNVGDLLLIDDSYNANPASMKAAIEVLAQYPDSTLIIGDMGELGESALSAHRSIGAMAAKHNIKRVYVCGQYANEVAASFAQSSNDQQQSQAFATQQALITHLQSHTLISGACLVKGSRSAKMEVVVSHIQQALHGSQDAGSSSNNAGSNKKGDIC